MLPVLIAGLELSKSEETADLGHYDEARRWLDQATTFLPILAYNTDIVFQEGYFDQKLGVDSAASKLVTAIRDEEEGFNDSAAGRYADLLDPSNPEPVRDEAFRGGLRRALTDLNAGLADRASAALTRLLTIDPSCIKANYALQLADLGGNGRTRWNSTSRILKRSIAASRVCKRMRFWLRRIVG